MRRTVGMIDITDSETCDTGDGNTTNTTATGCNISSPVQNRTGGMENPESELMMTGMRIPIRMSLQKPVRRAAKAYAPRCGDGTIRADEGEICDDGNTDDGDYCTGNCEPAAAVCGDGVVEAEASVRSVTMATPMTATTALAAAAVLTVCGDGVIEGDEFCDDGSDNSRRLRADPSLQCKLYGVCSMLW